MPESFEPIKEALAVAALVASFDEKPPTQAEADIWRLPLVSELGLPRDRNPYHVYLASLGTDQSRSTMVSVLARVSSCFGKSPEEFAWHLLRYQHVQALRTRSGAAFQPATTNKMLSAVRGVCREAFQLELMPGDAFVRIKFTRNVRGTRLPRGRYVEPKEIGVLLEACPNNMLGRRDAALIGLLYGGGLRRAEAASLVVDAVSIPKREIRVLGKGNKERLVPLDNAILTLQRWFEVRYSIGPWLFPSLRKSSRLNRTHCMTGHGVSYALRGAAERAGFDLEKPTEAFTPHDLRRSYLTNLLNNGADLALVMKLAGHEQIETTAIYDMRKEHEKREAAKRLSFPLPKAWG